MDNHQVAVAIALLGCIVFVGSVYVFKDQTRKADSIYGKRWGSILYTDIEAAGCAILIGGILISFISWGAAFAIWFL